MPICLITSVVFKKGTFGIGYNNDLLYKIPADMKFFKQTTINHTVIMGYKTWLSLPNRPLKNRINIVLTNRHQLNKSTDSVIFTTFNKVKNLILSEKNKSYYIIGGSEIYSLFLNDIDVSPEQLIINHISPDITCNIDTYFNPDKISKYSISSYSEKMFYDNLSYRYIYYKKSSLNQEQKYMNLLKEILYTGKQRVDRTGVGTFSLFGRNLRFNIENSIPLMTSKRISFKNIVEELLWFCKGDTDANNLREKGVNIWNGNSSREFLDSRGLYNNKEGDCGPIYGHQWRRFGQRKGEKNTGIDQLKYVEDLLKNDPYSRRIILSAWNPYDLKDMALLPCHIQVQWYVENKGNKKMLNCMFTMRSSDFALASCYNIVSYSILTYILAKKHNMYPGEIIYNAGDCHIYTNHLEAINEQLKRSFRPFPSLHLDDSIKTKSWEEIEYKDFELIGYFPNPSIKMDMAI